MRRTLEDKAHEYAFDITCAYVHKKPGSSLNESERKLYEAIKKAWLDGKHGKWRLTEFYTPEQLANQEYRRRHYQKNKERIKAKNLNYYYTNREEIKEKRRTTHGTTQSID